MRQYIVSATAAFGSILVMAATSNLPDSRARAADECHAAPKGSAPQGSRWYYRTDRATQRKCWFLAEPGAKASAGAAAPATPPMRLPPERPKRQADATAAAAPAAKAKPNTLDAKAYAVTPLGAETSGDATSGQAASRQATSREDASGTDQLVASALLERGQALMSVAQSEGAAKSSADDGMPAVWPVLARAEVAETDEAPSSPIRFASLLVFLAGVLASGIFAARVILKRSTRVRVDRAVYPSRLAPLAPQDDASRLGALSAHIDSSEWTRRAPQEGGREAVPFQRKVAA
jgi:hypothetical protein